MAVGGLSATTITLAEAELEEDTDEEGLDVPYTLSSAVWLDSRRSAMSRALSRLRASRVG